MKPQLFQRSTFLAALVCALAFGIAVPQRAAADEADPPSRAGRISYLNGAVSMQPSGAGDWTEAVVNRPITTGDKLWTDSGARAELHAGAAALHLGERTGFSFLNLDDNTIQIRLTEGSLNVRVRELRSGETYEIDTPNLAFTVTHAGSFRVDVNENGDVTNITAFSGEGDVTTSGQNYSVHAGDRAEFTGAENPRMETSAARSPDDLDRWAAERDSRAEHSVSAKYVSRDVTGYEDLDDHGVWREAPEYGPVWYPSVGPGWAPYRYGHWVWISPWGWTWVEDEPWGFAPFHYGRWAFIGGSWGWCPGPFFGRPFFAPALVGFVGGRHFFFGVGFGEPIGWFPLGFGEPFFPGFRCSRVFITNINITNTRFRDRGILNNRNFNHFANQRVAGGITAVPRSAFVNSQSVSRAALSGSAVRGMASARASSNVGVSPTQRSMLGARGAVSTHVPTGAFNRPVTTRSAAVSGNARLGRSSASMPGRPATVREDRPPSSARGSMPSVFSRGQSGRASASASVATNHAADRPPANWNHGASNSRVSGGAQGGAQINRPAASSSRVTSHSADRPSASWNGNSSSGRQSGRSYSSGSSSTYSGRSYSAPSRSYSAPSRSYSAPNRSYSSGRSSSGGRSYSGGGSSGGRSYSGGGRSSSGSSGSHGSSGSSSHGGSSGSSHGRH